MLKVTATKSFKKDIKLARKRGCDLSPLRVVVNKLKQREILEPKYKDHELSGKYSFLRECHVKPDWLLIYRIDEDEIELILFRFGTHSDLF